MEERLEQLEAEYNATETRLRELAELLYIAEKECKRERIINIEEKIPAYTARLERLGRIIKDFTDTYQIHGEVQYAFHYIDEGYVSDGYDPMSDPMDWNIVEYDLLGMNQNLEIVFDYSTLAVKDFIENWMKTTFPTAEYQENVDKLFGFRNNRLFNKQ